MQITRIAKAGKEDQFAVFIDGVLKLFLSGQSVMDHELAPGLEISEQQIKELSRLSNEDLLYLKALKYISVRIRSEGEVQHYLKRNKASEDQQKAIIKRLKKLDLINDERFAAAFIHDKLLATPASKRKIAYELKKKRLAADVIESSLNADQISDDESLHKLITIKRRQGKYQDDLKLMQYLVRNGFNYGDVKRALKYSSEQD